MPQGARPRHVYPCPTERTLRRRATMVQAITVRPSCSAIGSIARGTSTGAAPFGMVVQVPTVGLVAECGICDRAKDQTVPRLVNCSRWHADDLAAVHRRPATSQPLPQAGLDQFLWLPGACLEHGGRQFEFRDDPVDSFQLASSHRDHPAICSRFRFLTGESASRHAETRQRSPAGRTLTRITVCGR